MKIRKSILFSILIINICLQTGCRSLRTSDYSPNNIKLDCPLPSLESLIDINSFEKIYQGKSTSGLEILCQPKQDFHELFVNDAISVIDKDIKQNFFPKPSEEKGYLVLRVMKMKGKSFDSWAVFGGLILTIPQILGAPFCQYKFEVWLDVDVRNSKNVTIATYSGYGKNTANLGYYYGCKEYPQKAGIEAMKRALNEVKQKMSIDCNTLTLSLNKSMDDIQQERIKSAEQSKLETDELIKGNTLFNEKEYSSSLKFYNAELDKHPNHIFALMNRGRSQSSLGSNVAAVKDFTRIIELDPKNVDAYYYRGVAYGNILELNAAIYNYNKAIELSPNMAQAYLMRAAAEEDLELNDASIKDYQQVLKLNPDLIFAKERVNVLQNRIQQNQIHQQQQADQDRVNKLNALSAALNNLSNTLNSVSKNNTSTNNSVTNTSTSNRSSSSLTLKQKVCPYCKGTKVNPSPSYGASFGLDKTSKNACTICGKYEIHYHKSCIPCQGKGYIESY